MKKYLVSIILTSLILFLGVAIFAQPIKAAGVKDTLNVLNSSAGDDGAGFTVLKKVEATTIAAKIGSVINVFLGFVGAIATLYIIYGGFVWITAGGNQEQVTKARKYILNAALGLVVASIAYLIIALVINVTTTAIG